MRKMGFGILLLVCASLIASPEAEFDWSPAGFESFEQPGVGPCIEGEGVVEGVNVVTGKYFDSTIDISTHGLDPLFLERNYFRAKHNETVYLDYDAPNYLGWYLNYDRIFYIDKLEQNIALSDRTGAFIHFQRLSLQQPFRIPVGGLKGFMNNASGVLSGQTNVASAYLLPDGKGGFDLHSGNGSVRHYQGRERTGKNTIKALSVWERKPSGNTVIHGSNEVKTVARDGKTVMNWLRYRWEHPQSLVVETSDGRNVKYIAGPKINKVKGNHIRFLDRVVLSDGNQIKYHYDERLFQDSTFLLGKDLPGGRFVRFQYDTITKKVKTLQMPVGADHNAITTHRFDYGISFTDVYDANNNRTRYHYNKEGRITQVDRPSGSLERSVWAQNGCLEAKALLDVNGNAILARRFHYDAACNVITEQVYGNLSGKSQAALLVTAEGYPIENGVECYTKNYTYSTDGWNLLLSETDGVAATHYAYEPNTNLLTGKFIYDQNNRLQLRQFRTYDFTGALASLIEDDGDTLDADCLSGCSYRKVTCTSNRTYSPGIGQPESVEEKYVDIQTKEERLLKRTVYLYNPHNECIQEDVYDGSGAYCFSIHRSYDVMGRRVLETDACGNTTQWVYDPSGNVIQKMGPGPGNVVNYLYDFSNRLIMAKEEGGGAERTVRYRYDLVGNQIAEIDEGGGETLYMHDSGGRVVQITYPPTLNEKDETFRAVEHKRYDAADNLVEWINVRGDRILTDYNIRGQPVHIQTLTKEGKNFEEFFEYDLRGNCIKKTAPKGLLTYMTYDFLDRIVQTEQHAHSGELLSKTESVYKAIFLTSTTDGEGKKTCFTYDGAGREKTVEKEIDAGHATRTEKIYDSFGRPVAILDWYGEGQNEYTIKRMHYDPAGRIIEEKAEDFVGRIYEKRAYGYDEAGNLIKKVEWTNDGEEVVTYCRFDGFGRMIEKIDPLGSCWRTEYRENVSNGRGQLCPYKKEIDPSGCYTETFYDARRRPERIVRKNVQGDLLTDQKQRYDAAGNQILRMDALHAADPQTKWSTIRYSYTYNGKQTQIVENAESEAARCEHFHYNTFGELIRKDTLMGTQYFTYDSLGRLTHQTALSREGNVPSAEIRYIYDCNGRVMEAFQNGQMTQRSYDGLGNLVYEKQSSGLSIAYAYDRQGRRTQIKLPDGTSVEYRYQGPHLYQVHRLGEDNKVLYIHTYVKKDLSGRTQNVKLIGKAGGILFRQDRGGRLHSIATTNWNQQAVYDPCGNLLGLSTREGSANVETDFEYDQLDRLIAEKSSLERTYAYDSIDNRLDGELDCTNQLIKAAGCTFLWDAEGRLLSSSGAASYKCTYDALGRLATFDSTTYRYDAFHRRIGKNNEWFLYDGDQEMALCTRKGQIYELRILGEGMGAERGATIAIETNGRTYAPLHDIRGNIVALIDAYSGKTVESYDYSAFGQVRIFDQYKGKVSFSWMNNSWLWNGKRMDLESGWTFFGKRYYNPQIGRWTTPDPLGYFDGPNVYAYVHNNPLTHFDLYGEFDVFRIMQKNTSHERMGRLNHRLVGMTEWIGKNMIPLPGARDLVEGMGCWGAGGKFLALTDYRKTRIPLIPFVGKKASNSFEEIFRERDFNIKPELYMLFNSPKGVAADLIESRLLKFGGVTPPEKLIIDIVRDALRQGPCETLPVNVDSSIESIYKKINNQKNDYKFSWNEPFLSPTVKSKMD